MSDRRTPINPDLLALFLYHMREAEKLQAAIHERETKSLDPSTFYEREIRMHLHFVDVLEGLMKKDPLLKEAK